jgi:hypothetical protein
MVNIERVVHAISPPSGEWPDESTGEHTGDTGSAFWHEAYAAIFLGQGRVARLVLPHWMALALVDWTSESSGRMLGHVQSDDQTTLKALVEMMFRSVADLLWIHSVLWRTCKTPFGQASNRDVVDVESPGGLPVAGTFANELEGMSSIGG